ncbi:MAG: ATP-binding protein [Erysipelotrichaceae bacterium]|nr:ATP-binding protein [Erysipelotrichaceae bacterium]
MLKRSISADLEKWKNRNHHPLVLSGLRQTGKTFSVQQFGNDNYLNVVYIDLRKSVSLHSAFDGDFDVNKMTSRITANIPNARFLPGQTLLILDEIQDCPNARSSLKYWDLDGRYDVIATGSFLGVKGFRRPYPRGIPVGYEEHLVMYPLTFREFLNNYGMPEDVLNYVQKSISSGTVIDKAIHDRMRELYLEYLIVGGMPEAVNVFFENHDLNAVKEVQCQIIESIKADFGRYIDANGNKKVNEVLKLRAEACLNSLPSQLSKEYKKFQFSLVEGKTHAADKADALQYLVDIGLVIKSYNLSDISLPLEAAKIANEYKAFYADTGLLISQMEQGTAAKVLAGELGAHKGAITENMVAVGFHENGQKLYYYRGSSGSPELDFVTMIKTRETIIECKSTNGRATSMKHVLQHPEKYGKHPAMKIADTNIGEGEGFRTLPIYYCGFIEPNERLIVKRKTFDDLSIPER